jgi:putative flippase GtrA
MRLAGGVRATEPIKGALWFACFGALGLGFDVGLLWLLVRLTALPQAFAVALAFAATYAINFFLNRRFSFTDQGAAEGRVAGQLVRFAPQVGLDFALTLTSVELLTGLGIALLPARVLAGGTNAVINYTMYRWWTFRPARRGVTAPRRAVAVVRSKASSSQRTTAPARATASAPAQE